MCQMLPVFLDCPFLIARRFSLAFIYDMHECYVESQAPDTKVERCIVYNKCSWRITR
jgi:hypothetical protein